MSAPEGNKNHQIYLPGQPRPKLKEWGGAKWGEDELHIRDALNAWLKANGITKKEFWIRFYRYSETTRNNRKYAPEKHIYEKS